jgi:hypothetical protein
MAIDDLVDLIGKIASGSMPASLQVLFAAAVREERILPVQV